MDTQKLIPIDFSRNITPFVPGDKIWNDTIKFKITIQNQFHADGFNKNNYNDDVFYVVSFADRENAGRQPVGDDVVVDTGWAGSIGYPMKAQDKNWINHAEDETWKPNHAAMLKQWQESQIKKDSDMMPQVITESNHKLNTAAKTLEQLNYSYNGAELWKPPIGEKPDYIEAPTFTQAMKDSGSRLTIGMHYLDDSDDRCEYIGISASSIIGRYVDMNNVRSDHLSISDGDDIKPIQADDEKLFDALYLATVDDDISDDLNRQLVMELMNHKDFTITLKG